MNKLLFCALSAFAAVSAFAQLTTKTNVWTGNAGNFEWSDMGNWQAEGGGTPAAVSEYVVWDFSALAADSTIVNNSATDISVCGLVFGANQGTIAFSGTGTGKVMYYARRDATNWHETNVTVPSGTTVDYDALSKDDDWTQFVFVLRGGGAFRLGSGVRCSTTQDFRIYDIDFTVKANQNATRNKTLRYSLYSASSVLRFELSRQIGSIDVPTAGILPKVYLNGNTVKQRFISTNDDTLYKIMDSGTLQFANGYARKIGDAVTAGQDVTLIGVDADLTTGSAADNTATAPFAYQSVVNAQLTAYGNQTLTSLNMAGPESAVIAASADKTVTIGGCAEGTSFIGSLSGVGNYSFDLGAGKSAVLDGRVDYNGSTEVKSGTVLTRGTDKTKVSVADHSALVAYWNFERDVHGAGATDVTDVDPIVFRKWWGGEAPAVTNVALNGAGKSSRYAHFFRPKVGEEWKDGRYEGLQNDGTMPEKSGAMSNDYTIVMYIRPDPATMEGGEYEVERPNNVMELFYNDWTAYRMNWVRFSTKQKILFGGFNDNDYGDQQLTDIPDLFDGAWHQLAWSYSQGDKTFRAYVDGVLKMSWKRTYHSFHLDSAKIIFGARTQGDWGTGAKSMRQTYDGDMDNIQLWGRALSADEIAADWARGGVIRRTAAPPAKKAPIALWTFDDATDFGKDTSGNGYDLTQTGTADYLVALDLPGTHGKAVKIKAGNTPVNFRLATIPDAIKNAQNFTLCVKFLPFSIDNKTSPNVFQWCDSAQTSGSNVKVYYSNWPAILTVYAAANNTYWEPDSFTEHGTTGFKRGMWENMTITYNATTRNFIFYRSGIERQKMQVTLTMANATEFLLGCGHAAPGSGFLDEARFYDQELSADEVRELAREMGTDNAENTAQLPPTDLTIGAGATLAVRDDLTVASLSGAGNLALVEGDLAVNGRVDFTGVMSGDGAIRLPGNVAYMVNDTEVIPVSANGPIVLPANGSLTVTAPTYPANRRIVIARGTPVTAPDGIAGWTANLPAGDVGKFYLTATEFGFKVSSGMIILFK